ncbi:site-2 protease family protein [Sulfolobus acidocaldarius]|uniref:Conserved protein n=4 Tax=Sulfolobus acidocaldarius TaxID=2285 RepID=Q4JCI4_SULAC|nr:site-2 protease family protein [Sulfolobus acidocaldarius]AAY79495.1 conserved protein [Sulfolobus acidocaldarius DSM 639]AGE70044.1 hypothetical protein SacN8_00315 [Sulfolobus acidocaldarius N8]AGE72319.1 hypothetical protein SacRon12I_00315 [Sulfolobus acidocaldarius Ron12/I]ALU29530.1 S2P metalloprotease [Sulfolobus acidocaldarius]ALU32260.1 S2P metalloprotease [Sulfolobus acidocaldarius]
MNNIVYFALGILLFWLVMYTFRRRLEKRGFVVYPFMLLWKKQTRSEWFPNFARKRAYKIFDKIAVVLGVISLVLGLALILYVFLNSVFPSSSGSTVSLQPIIPGITVGLDQLPYILLAIGISVTLHELAHAISATSNGIKVRSGGLLLLIFFPGAFVEPDEEEFKSASSISRLKIISAGIAVNLILAAIFFPLANFLPANLSQGLLIVGEKQYFPAYNASIPVNSIILKVDGNAVKVPQQLSYYLDQGRTHILTLLYPNGSINSITINTTQTHQIGVYITYYFPQGLLGLLQFITWMFTVNFSLALLNGAPLIITDGGKVFTEITRKLGLGDRESYLIQSVFTVILIGAILFSFNPLG